VRLRARYRARTVAGGPTSAKEVTAMKKIKVRKLDKIEATNHPTQYGVGGG